MRLVMHNARKGRPVLMRTASGRKLVAERLAELRRQNAVALGWTITGSPDQMVGQRPGTSEFSSYAESLPMIARKAKP